VRGVFFVALAAFGSLTDAGGRSIIVLDQPQIRAVSETEIHTRRCIKRDFEYEVRVPVRSAKIYQYHRNVCFFAVCDAFGFQTAFSAPDSQGLNCFAGTHPVSALLSKHYAGATQVCSKMHFPLTRWLPSCMLAQRFDGPWDGLAPKLPCNRRVEQ
jgi:hypothetical protein